MRFILGATVLGMSFLLGVNKCNGCMKRVEKSRILLQICEAVSDNNHYGMLDFYDVFIKIHGENFDPLSVYNSESALSFIEKNYSKARDFDRIFPLLKKLTVCGAWEFDDVAAELKEICKNALKTEENLSKKDGLSAAVLYPGIAAIMLTVLI